MLEPTIPAVNTWRVTTEGDVEGKTTKQLGSYSGHIVEIAKLLSGHASYGLTFEPANLQNVKYREPKSSVIIKVWGDDALSNGNAKAFQKWIGDHEGLKAVEKTNYYKSVSFRFRPTEEDKKREADREEFERLKKEYGW